MGLFLCMCVCVCVASSVVTGHVPDDGGAFPDEEEAENTESSAQSTSNHFTDTEQKLQQVRW